MSTPPSGNVDNLELEKLNATDKAELVQFLANEQRRSQIQSREFAAAAGCPLSDLLRSRNTQLDAYLLEQVRLRQYQECRPQQHGKDLPQQLR